MLRFKIGGELDRQDDGQGGNQQGNAKECACRFTQHWPQIQANKAVNGDRRQGKPFAIHLRCLAVFKLNHLVPHRGAVIIVQQNRTASKS